MRRGNVLAPFVTFVLNVCVCLSVEVEEEEAVFSFLEFVLLLKFFLRKYHQLEHSF